MNATQHGRAELSMRVDAVLWKDGAEWRGECIDIAAVAHGATFSAAYNALFGACYTTGLNAISDGRLPDRHPDDVDPEVMQRWASLETTGASINVQHLCRTNGDGRTQVRLAFDVNLNVDVPGMFEDAGIGDLRVVLIPADGTMFAQCLEHDICAVGTTQQEAMDALDKTLRLRVTVDRMLGKKPLNDSRPAPEKYWKLYEDGEPLTVKSPGFHVSRAA